MRTVLVAEEGAEVLGGDAMGDVCQTNAPNFAEVQSRFGSLSQGKGHQENGV
jgi:hypothetical protein